MKKKQDKWPEDRIERVGLRIKRIRGDRNWTQAKLAMEAGLDPGTVQKIECGYHEAREEKYDAIANALNVNKTAFFDPNPHDALSVLYTLFEIDAHMPITIENNGNQRSNRFNLSFSDAKLNGYLEEWAARKCYFDTGEKTGQDKAEYNLWKWNFPDSETKEADKKKSQLQQRINKLKKQIEILQVQLWNM